MHMIENILIPPSQFLVQKEKKKHLKIPTHPISQGHASHGKVKGIYINRKKPILYTKI